MSEKISVCGDDLFIRVLETGSTGNCILVNDMIALDMGVAWKKVAPYSKGLMLVFAGHEHGDHLKKSTVRALSENRPTLRFCGGKWLAPLFLSSGVSAKNIDILEAGKLYDYGLFQVSPITLHHDVENYGLRLYINEKKVLYATDTGYMGDIEAIGYDLYLLESNHTEEEIEERATAKIAAGEYAYEFRAAQTHLSQEQAENWLYQQMGPNSRYVFLHAHTERRKKKSES